MNHNRIQRCLVRGLLLSMIFAGGGIFFAAAQTSPIRIETENMTLDTSTGYTVRTATFASGGAFVNLANTGGTSGTAQTSFSGASGTYNVVVGYFDENDGIAQLQVSIGGQVVDSWSLNESTSSNAPGSATARQRTVATGLAVANGATIFIQGTRGSGDNASIDYIDFTVVSAPSPSAPGMPQSPSPSDGAAGVATNAMLSWTAGTNANSHDVYFGTNNPPALQSSRQIATSYNPGALASGTTYYWRITEWNSTDITVGPIWSFTTVSAVPLPPPSSDTTPPTLSAISASSISTSGATISWNTNEVADTQVDYGLAVSYGSQTILNSSLVTSHIQSLSGLISGTTYHYRARSRDAVGNIAVSSDQTFTTSIVTSPPPSGNFLCTEVLGFSQTGMWYLNNDVGTFVPGASTFEPLVGDSAWQLRALGSAGLSWQDPNYIGWTDPSLPLSPCNQNSTNPDRVLLTISTPGGNQTVDWWVTNIRAAIATIRTKYSNLRQIILQPVVGGPNNSVCYYNGNLSDPVQASLKHPTIDQAIPQLVGGDIIAGMSPEVRTCADYRDNTGHFVAEARGPIGTVIGNFYAGLVSPPPPPPPAPTCTPRSLVASSVTPSTVAANGAYTISCDYGATTNGINVTVGSGSCTFANFTGTAANFTCIAGTVIGTFANSCTLANITPDNYCARTDAIASLTVVAPSTKFSLNDRVYVSSGPLNVRGTPSTSGTLLGTQPTGTQGAVIGGPTNANGFNWWQINYDSGVDGWSAEDFLERVVVSPTPPPPPPPTSGGTIFYVDGACPTSGNGSTLTCGTSGPFRTIGEGVLAMQPGYTLNIRGAHGGFDGAYFEAIALRNNASVPGKALQCSASQPCTIQGYANEMPIIRGMTLRNDWISQGNGIYSRTMEASPTPHGTMGTHERDNFDPMVLVEGSAFLGYDGDNITSPRDSHWSYNPTTHQIYVNPSGSVDPGSTTYVPHHGDLVYIESPTSYVTLRNLDLEGSRGAIIQLDSTSSLNRVTNITLSRLIQRFAARYFVQASRGAPNLVIEDTLSEYGMRGYSWAASTNDGFFGYRLFGAHGGIIRRNTVRHVGATGEIRLSAGGTPPGWACPWCDAPWNDTTYTRNSGSGTGIQIKQSDNVLVQDNIVEDVSTVAYSLDVSRRVTVERNTARRARTGLGVRNFTPTGDCAAPASSTTGFCYNSDHVIRNNSFDEVGYADMTGCAIAIIAGSERHSGALMLAQIYNNMISHVGFAGICVENGGSQSGGSTTPTLDLLIAHNTVYGARSVSGVQPSRGLLVRDATQNVVIRNNLFDTMTSDGLVLTTASMSGISLDGEAIGAVGATSCQVRWGVSAFTIIPTGGTCSTLGSFTSANPTQETNGRTGVVLFANTSLTPPNLHLVSGSAGIDTGVSVAAVTTDIDGQVRPSGSGPDAGADEFISGVVLPPPPPPPPPSDTTPPSISLVTASSVTTSGATITWTTNEASNSQVDYGLTTAYGSSSSLNTSMVTSHATTLSALNSGTTYHYRVRSADTSGNLVFSSDFTFTTTAVSPPPPPPPPPSTKFLIGDRVYVSSGPLNVRSIPSLSGTLLGTQATNNQGVIIGGPIFADGFSWWQVNYDAGADGWSVESFLERVVVSPTPPPPPPTPSFDFTLANGGSRTVVQGSSIANSITPTLVSGTTQPLTFSVSGLPAGASASFSPATCMPNCSTTLTITTIASTPVGTFTLVVTAIGGGVIHTTSFTLTVTAAPVPPFDFTFSSLSNLSLTQGNSASTGVSITLLAGAAQPVSFSLAGLPAGITASFVPISCTPTTTCSVTLSIGTQLSTTPGNYTISLTGLAPNGVGGTVAHTSTFMLTVNAVPPAPSSTLQISGIQASQITGSSAVISWTTNIAANSRVDYGTTPSYGFTASSNITTTTHTLTLTNLSRKTTYNYRVISQDGAGNTASSTNLIFITHARNSKPPPVTGVLATVGSVTLSWQNPVEYEFFSGVKIERSAEPLLSFDPAYQIGDVASTTQVFHDTNVIPGTTYVYTIFAYDDQGIYADPASITFTTPGTDPTSGGDSGIRPIVPPSVVPPKEQNTTLCTNPVIPGLTIIRWLAAGIKGPDVKSLQQYLNSLGVKVSESGPGSPGQETEHFGPATVAAVQVFQCREGIVCSGTVGSSGYGAVGPRTRAALARRNTANICAKTPPPASTGLTIIRWLAAGIKGPDVKSLQQYLNSLGVKVSESGPGSPGQETEHFGPATMAAVQVFQCREGIVCSGTVGSSGYGAVGPRTRAALIWQ